VLPPEKSFNRKAFDQAQSWLIFPALPGCFPQFRGTKNPRADLFIPNSASQTLVKFAVSLANCPCRVNSVFNTFLARRQSLSLKKLSFSRRLSTAISNFFSAAFLGFSLTKNVRKNYRDSNRAAIFFPKFFLLEPFRRFCRELLQRTRA